MMSRPDPVVNVNEDAPREQRTGFRSPKGDEKPRASNVTIAPTFICSAYILIGFCEKRRNNPYSFLLPSLPNLMRCLTYAHLDYCAIMSSKIIKSLKCQSPL